LGIERVTSRANHEEARLMITGVHALLFSKEAEQVREFFREALGLRSVDAGNGWLIFALPPAELGVHPTVADPSVELYLLCDDLDATITELGAKGVTCSEPIAERDWGRLSFLELPGGARFGLYEPRHPTALDLSD
jgi:predicted enzyme related to lactoylglutathione lyase